VQALKNKMSARKLGYYLFFNLRREDSGLALQEEDVHSSAERAGLRHKESAWSLLDRNGDTFATLDEVLDSVEKVYNNRKALARTLKDSESVVGQARRRRHVVCANVARWHLLVHVASARGDAIVTCAHVPVVIDVKDADLNVGDLRSTGMRGRRWSAPSTSQCLCSASSSWSRSLTPEVCSARGRACLQACSPFLSSLATASARRACTASRVDTLCDDMLCDDMLCDDMLRKLHPLLAHTPLITATTGGSATVAWRRLLRRAAQLAFAAGV
jgi:hypothetical protein